MKFFVITSVILATVFGRPEPPKGYQYASPIRSLTNSYSAPLASVGPIPNESPTGLDGSTLGVDSNVNESDGSTNGSKDSSITNHNDSFSSSSDESDFSKFEGASDDSQAVVEKTIYVHLPSPELEEGHQERAVVQPPQPRVHYKIIFIKAPATSTLPPVIPPLPQNEERTLVYVLVQKPEEQEEIVIPTAEPTEPSKPEVYFIKYKTQKDESSKSVKAEDSSLKAGGSFSSKSKEDKEEGNEISKKYGVPNSSGSY